MPKRIFAWALALWIVLGFSASVQAAPAISDAQVSALFMNVGKADSALFMLGEKRYLVDTGTKESAEAMLKALDSFAVTHLEGVFITHTHKDHVGGLKALLESDITVDRLYAPSYFVQESIATHPVYQRAMASGVPLTWLNAGDILPVAEGTAFHVLGPIIRDTDEENNNSLVLRLTTLQGDMILTGDMLVHAEQVLLTAGVISTAAVLKVGHHGSKHASSEAFLYTVRPQVAVIPTDTAVDKNTPSGAVMRRLWAIGAEVLVTQKATCGVLVTLKEGNAIARLMDYDAP